MTICRPHTGYDYTKAPENQSNSLIKVLKNFVEQAVGLMLWSFGVVVVVVWIAHKRLYVSLMRA